jgi:hypothetical protein
LTRIDLLLICGESITLQGREQSHERRLVTSDTHHLNGGSNNDYASAIAVVSAASSFAAWCGAYGPAVPRSCPCRV